MGLRVKRYGPLSTMVVVGRLVGTFEPALVIVTMAQMASASARANTSAPNQPTGQPAAKSAGRNGKGKRPGKRRPNDDLSGGWRVVHGGTCELPGSSSMSPCRQPSNGFQS